MSFSIDVKEMLIKIFIFIKKNYDVSIQFYLNFKNFLFQDSNIYPINKYCTLTIFW